MDTNVSKNIYIIRTYSAGVHVGEVASYDVTSRSAVLNGGHRIWRWRGANTLTELSLRGASMDEYTRISERGPDGHILMDVIEVIPCTPEAAANLTTPRWLD